MGAEDLLAALSAGRVAAVDTPYGLGAQGVNAALPNLVDPYASVGQNAAYVGGASLLSALLTGLGRSSAREENAIIAPLQAEFINPSTSAQRRSELLGGGYGDKLSPLQAVLLNSQIELSDAKAKKQQELELSEPFDIRKEQRGLGLDQEKTTNSEIIKRQAQVGKVFNPVTKTYEDVLPSDADISAEKILSDALATKKSNIETKGFNPEVVKEEDAARAELAKLPSVAQFMVQQKTFPLVKAFKDEDTKSSDVGFVYNYVKSLDDGAVRNEEINMANSSNPLIQKWRSTLEGALTGQSTLTVELKNQMYKELEMAQGNLYKQATDDINKRYGIASQRGVTDIKNISPIDLSLKFGVTEATPTPTPDAGALAELRRRGVIK